MISRLHRQVRFQLLPENWIEGARLREVNYIADFTYFKDGELVVEDTKGYVTETFTLKKKMFAAKYERLIREIRSGGEDI